MKNNKYTVSIIIPVYNVEQYIEECIDSILQQTFEKFEVILVNDGSTDSSGIICDEYSKNDKRIRVIHQKNGGVSSARNTGLDYAIGKYITFIDSDDYVNENYIEKLYKNIKENNADIAVCNNKRFITGHQVNDYKIDNNISILDTEECLENLYGQYWERYVVVWGKLYKKDIFKDIRFPVGKINEDLFIIYKLYLKARKIIYDNSQLYFYRNTEESITNKKFTYKNFDNLEAFEEHISFYKKNKYYNLEKKAIRRYCYHINCFYKRFKTDNGDLKGLYLIRKKHKNIKKYVKNSRYFTSKERDFINAPWCDQVLIEPYWFFIAIKNKIKKGMKGRY